jgi:bacterioferritin-associated ferredoxin
VIRIDRCYCFGVLFSTLDEISRETGACTVEELQSKIVFGRQCELCHAYVRRTLETGQVVFNEIIDQE